MNRAVGNTAEQVFMEWDIESFGNVVRNCIAESYGILILDLMKCAVNGLIFQKGAHFYVFSDKKV